jgi:hypothetical protein
MKLPEWISTDGVPRFIDGQAHIVITVNPNHPAFWAAMLDTAWHEYRALWWHPLLWWTIGRLLCRFLVASWKHARAV